MKKDIETRADIEDLMRRFYAEAMSDGTIGYIFTDVAKLNLAHHLPVISDFWESILFGTGSYQKHRRHPMMIHAELSEKTPLFFEHFNRWLEIFYKTVDESFAGEHAETIKIRANLIANRMLDYVGETVR